MVNINIKETAKNTARLCMCTPSYNFMISEDGYLKKNVFEKIQEKNPDFEFKIDDEFVEELEKQIKENGVYFDLIEIKSLNQEYDENDDEIISETVIVSNQEKQTDKIKVTDEDGLEIIQWSRIVDEFSYLGIRLYYEDDEMKMEYGCNELTDCWQPPEFIELGMCGEFGDILADFMDEMIVYND